MAAHGLITPITKVVFSNSTWIKKTKRANQYYL